MSEEINLELIIKRNCIYYEGANIQDLLNETTHIRLDREKLKSLEGLHFVGAHVTHLYLQHNLIENLNQLVESGLIQLRFVSLANNKISQVPDLRSFIKLSFLDLSNNSIHSIEGVLPSTLFLLKLDGNPIFSDQLKLNALRKELPNWIDLAEESNSSEFQESAQTVLNPGSSTVRGMAGEIIGRSTERCMKAEDKHQSKMTLLNAYTLPEKKNTFPSNVTKN